MKTQNAIFYLFLFIFIFSCKERNIKIPMEIIPKDTMSHIIADLQIIDAAIVINSMNGDSTLPKNIKSFYETVFKKYKVNKTKFKQSMHFYVENIEMLEKIYEDATNILVIKQSEEAIKNK
ncbi:MAG: DUF4296 domain-containing protein [Bacteroidales bacterium]|jgi:hypothetical protein